MKQASFCAAFVLAGLLPICAQTQEGAAPLGASRAGDIQAALDAWRSSYGSSWKIHHEPATGYARFLFGGAKAAASQPQTDADYVALARAAFDHARPLMGIDPETLSGGKVHFAPLALIGSSNKISVEFRQQWQGVPVLRGFANALFDVQGRLLSLDTTGLPDLKGFDVQPELDAAGALEAATAEFARLTGLQPTEGSAPALMIVPEEAQKSLRPALAWQVKLMWKRDGFEPIGYALHIAAQGEARLVSKENLVHHFDVGGTVTTMSSPGLLPDEASNPPVARPVAYARIQTNLGTFFTDQFGHFNIPGASGPLQATFTYVGTYNNVQNAAGAEYSLVTNLQTGSTNNVLMNPAGDPLVTPQANCFVQINILRDWIHSVKSDDNTFDIVALANANLAQTCNAYYDGVSTNYFLAGGGCQNTAYSTVVHHENGHWLNDLYGSGNGPDGFGEGNADNFATYLNDSPVVGEDFLCVGAGCYIRTGTNLKQFCGDANPGCYGEVHSDGEVIMGALWKVRVNLNTSLGNTIGDATANLLFNEWMNVYNDSQIKTIIEEHWLALDDNDGNIDNGTPHYNEINSGFVVQGFPGYTLALIQLTNLTSLPDTKDQAGPYGVRVDASSLIGGSISSVQLKYSVNNGAFQTLAMANSGGGVYLASLAGIASPAKVRYYAQATDNLGNTATLPKAAPAAFEDFNVGVTNVFFFDNFEQAGDNGWTHAQIATQDDWQKGAGAGKTGTSQGVSWKDPAGAYSGTRIWANDLGNTIGGQPYNGAYQPNVSNYLRSPLINCAAATGATLTFQRWLTVEQSIYDKAAIKVNGVQVWLNPAGEHVLDTAWKDQEIDISAQADGNPAVQLEWSLVTDGGLELGGWGIDDVSIRTLQPSPSSCLTTTYGAGLAGTNGVPYLDTAGEPVQKGNTSFQVKLKGARASSPAFFGLGFAQASIPLVGGTLLIVPAFSYARTTDLFGQASVALPIANDAGLVGAPVFLQAFVSDPATPQGFAITAGQQASICP